MLERVGICLVGRLKILYSRERTGWSSTNITGRRKEDNSHNYFSYFIRPANFMLIGGTRSRRYDVLTATKILDKRKRGNL